MKVTRHRVGALLAALGIAVLMVELFRYWIRNHPIHAWPVVIGSGLAFIGFYALDPIAAKDGGAFIERFTVRVLTAARGGRRSTDVSVTETEATIRPNVTDNDRGVG